MSENNKQQPEISNDTLIRSILDKFEISALNPMQEAAMKTIQKKSDVVLLSPTGTGKTLAFLLFLHVNWHNK